MTIPSTMMTAVHTIAGAVKRFFASSWMLPLGAASALLAGFLIDASGEWVYARLQFWPPWLAVITGMGRVLCSLGMLVGCTVPLWLVVISIHHYSRGEMARLTRCWGACVLAAMVAAGVGWGMLLQTFEGGHDLFARGLTIPEDREFVPPRHMVTHMGTLTIAIPPRVKELLGDKPELPGIRTGEAGEDTAADLAAPHLEKLSREAPQLLHEYMLRALYAEATTPHFHSPVLAADSQLYLAHENDPQTHALRAHLSKYPVYCQEQENGCTEADSPAARWKFPLAHGWYIAHQVVWYNCMEDPAKRSSLPTELQHLDAALAPLAEAPTRAQLDTLLPPVPKHPFLCLWAGDNAGTYEMLIVIPADYERGSFELRAHEVTTGEALRFKQRWLPEAKLGDVCRLICSDGSQVVYSGDWGQYYGSEWEIWFTPATGGEARCVSRQPFLMMGWQR